MDTFTLDYSVGTSDSQMTNAYGPLNLAGAGSSPAQAGQR